MEKKPGGNRRRAVVASLIGLLLVIPAMAAADHQDAFTSPCKQSGPSETPPRRVWVPVVLDGEDHAGAGFDRRFDDDARGEGVVLCARWGPGEAEATNVGVLSSNQTNGVVVVLGCADGQSCTTVLGTTGVTEGDINQAGLVGASHDGAEVWVDGNRTELKRREVAVTGEFDPDVGDDHIQPCVFGICSPEPIPIVNPLNGRIDTGLSLRVQEEQAGIDEERPVCYTSDEAVHPCEGEDPGGSTGPCLLGECAPPAPAPDSREGAAPRL